MKESIPSKRLRFMPLPEPSQWLCNCSTSWEIWPSCSFRSLLLPSKLSSMRGIIVFAAFSHCWYFSASFRCWPACRRVRSSLRCSSTISSFALSSSFSWLHFLVRYSPALQRALSRRFSSSVYQGSSNQNRQLAPSFISKAKVWGGLMCQKAEISSGRCTLCK